MFSQEVLYQLYQLWNSSPSIAGAAKKVYMFKNGSDNSVGHDKINKKNNQRLFRTSLHGSQLLKDWKVKITEFSPITQYRGLMTGPEELFLPAPPFHTLLP